MSKVRCVKGIQEGFEERDVPELRHRIEIGERLHAAKKNCAKLGAIVQGACQISPLRSENIDRRLAAFLGLRSNLDRQVNKRRNSDEHRRQLPNCREHFPLDKRNIITWTSS